MDDLGPIVSMGCIVVLLVAVLPLLFIWAVNTLFGLAIVYSLTNWFAALILCGFLGGSRSSSKS